MVDLASQIQFRYRHSHVVVDFLSCSRRAKMQSENEKSFTSPIAFASPNSTPKTYSQLNGSRSTKGIAKQRRNEKQQLLYHMEEVIDVQASLKN